MASGYACFDGAVDPMLEWVKRNYATGTLNSDFSIERNWRVKASGYAHFNGVDNSITEKIMLFGTLHFDTMELSSIRKDLFSLFNSLGRKYMIQYD